MKKYRVNEYNNDRYDKCKIIQKTNGKNFREHIYGSRKKIIIGNKVRLTTIPNGNINLGKLSNEKFVAFLGLFTKNLYRNLNDNPYLYTNKIEFKGVARSKNFKFWSNLKEGTLFYNIDLKSAYWQIAHLLGYIDTRLFNKYMFNDEYKQAKRLCISFLARKNKMVYHIGKNSFTIECDITTLKTCYNNIRNQLYDCVSKSVSLCDNYIEFNIDGLYVLAKDVDNARSFFDKIGLIYKITKCKKLNEYEFLSGEKIKNFKIKKYE
jgi:hypothetical protein